MLLSENAWFVCGASLALWIPVVEAALYRGLYNVVQGRVLGTIIFICNNNYYYYNLLHPIFLGFCYVAMTLMIIIIETKMAMQL